MQQDYFSQEVNRKGTLSVKWNPQAIKDIAATETAQPFWVADMDFLASAEVVEAAVQAARSGVYGYPYAKDKEQLFSAWAEKRHNWKVNRKDVVICPGMLFSIALLTEMLTGEGDGVIVPLPAYQPFVRIVRNLGRNLIAWPLLYDRESHQFSLDWEAFEALCKQAKLLIFCSPHNPSGMVFSEEDLKRLALIAKKHQVAIISDEIHADLSFNAHHPLLPIATELGCTAVTCMAPSKTFNIAGEHFSVSIFSDDKIRLAFLRRMNQLFLGENSFFSTTIALTAYEKGGPWLEQLLVYLQENIAFMEDFFKERLPSLAFIKPKASFIAFIDCVAIIPLVEKDALANPDLYDPKKSPNGGLLSRFFGLRAEVALNDGTWFGGDAYRGFVRFNYGTRRESVGSALERMEKAIRFLEETYIR
ncbi:MAG TPA: aminotransferase class I/II-fold pyridoxal phosphate-dependent enzyme [Sphaerochaeta sp.]|nr:aminotransferase class I/II-fold pyridoxal phosphate-dependent enzyme [Sphaerochaeta sp.]